MIDPLGITNTVEPSMIALWLLSAALLALGVIAHYRIQARNNTNGLGFVRYLGVLCGGIGVIGLPVANIVNPYITEITPIEATITVSLTITVSIIISHYGWIHLGQQEHDVTQNSMS